MPPTLLHRDHTSAVYALELVDDEVYTAGGDGFVLSWTAARPQVCTALARMPQPIYCLALANSARTLLAGTSNGDLHALDLRAKSLVGSVAAHPKGIYALLDLADGRVLAAGGDGTLTAWLLDAAGIHGLLRRVPLSDGKVRALALAPDGQLIAAASSDGHLHVLDAATLNAIATWPAHEGGANSLAFHPTKPVLISGGKDGHLRAWRLDDLGKEILALPAHRGTIYSVAIDQGRLAAVSRDKSISIWDLSTFSLLHRLGAAQGGHRHSVNAVRFNARGLVSAGDDRRVLSWSLDQNG